VTELRASGAFGSLFQSKYVPAFTVSEVKAVAKFRMSEITPKMKVAWCKTP
jgi:hypothetical protein